MTDEQQIGAAIDEMYAMISGPAGQRDLSRQANCFLPEARQVRTWVDEQGRPAKTSMGLDEYSRDTAPFFEANAFYEVETARRIDPVAALGGGDDLRRGDGAFARGDMLALVGADLREDVAHA